MLSVKYKARFSEKDHFKHSQLKRTKLWKETNNYNVIIQMGQNLLIAKPGYTLIMSANTNRQMTHS